MYISFRHDCFSVLTWPFNIANRVVYVTHWVVYVTYRVVYVTYRVVHIRYTTALRKSHRSKHGNISHFLWISILLTFYWNVKYNILSTLTVYNSCKYRTQPSIYTTTLSIHSSYTTTHSIHSSYTTITSIIYYYPCSTWEVSREAQQFKTAF